MSEREMVDDVREVDRRYQIERAAILATAVGIARVQLRGGNATAALATLDSAAEKTRALLAQTLPLMDTALLPLPEEPA